VKFCLAVSLRRTKQYSTGHCFSSKLVDLQEAACVRVR